MRVGHLKRTYLLKTETFVYTQLHLLQQTEAFMLVHERIAGAEYFPGPDVRAFREVAQGWAGRLSELSYRRARLMLFAERAFYNREIAASAPNLLHAHFAVDAAYFIGLKRQFRIPLLVSCYGYDISRFPQSLHGLGRFYLRPVWRSADVLLAMSNDMRRDLLALGCPAEKILVHYHGINLARFGYSPRPAAPEPLMILFLGSLGNPKKGVDDILRVFAQVAAQRPQVRLRIVGDGHLRPTLEHLAASLGIAEQVTFVGFVPHERLHEELGAAHVFCHPSVTTPTGDKEGIPGTVVEAMASGLPVVTTRHAGIPEMVRDGEDGFVVAERDEAALVRSLLRLIDSSELRQRMGQAAAQQARAQGDAMKQTARLEAIYRDVYRVYRAHRMTEPYSSVEG
jgi:colanic acid/amylovoran biosynthesis glycosyltransferase